MHMDTSRRIHHGCFDMACAECDEYSAELEKTTKETKMKKDYIRDKTGKVTYCSTNVAQMTPREYNRNFIKTGYVSKNWLKALEWNKIKDAVQLLFFVSFCLFCFCIQFILPINYFITRSIAKPKIKAAKKDIEAAEFLNPTILKSQDHSSE